MDSPGSRSDVVFEIAGMAAALGIVTLALFPFAVPFLILVVVAALPLAVPLLALAAVAAVHVALER